MQAHLLKKKLIQFFLIGTSCMFTLSATVYSMGQACELEGKASHCILQAEIDHRV